MHDRERVAAGPTVPAEVVGFRAARTLLMALGDAAGIGPGARVVASGQPFRVEVSDALLGRSLDGLGRPIDGLGPIDPDGHVRTRAAEAPRPPAPAPAHPRAVTLGVRAIDGLLAVRPRPAHRHLRRLGRRQVRRCSG